MSEINKAEFNYIVKGLNEAAEDQGFGDIIGGLEKDEVMMKLDEMDELPKVLVLNWLNDNGYFLLSASGYHYQRNGLTLSCTIREWHDEY